MCQENGRNCRSHLELNIRFASFETVHIIYLRTILTCGDKILSSALNSKIKPPMHDPPWWPGVTRCHRPLETQRLAVMAGQETAQHWALTQNLFLRLRSLRASEWGRFMWTGEGSTTEASIFVDTELKQAKAYLLMRMPVRCGKAYPKTAGWSLVSDLTWLYQLGGIPNFWTNSKP